MRILTIDRFDGKFAICEDDKKAAFAISKDELPKGASEGDVLRISDEAEITIDTEETEKRRNKNKKSQNKLWK